MILVSMDTHMYKKCITMKLKKKECSRLPASGCGTKGGNSVYFSLKNIFRISIQIISQR
jgi:hypothetical protein